jgi:hypothetical protein
MRAIKRVCAVALVGGLAVLGMGAGVAAAAPLEREHFHDVRSDVAEDFCGDLTVRLDVDARGMFLFNVRGPDGLGYGLESLHITSSVTNLANDKTFTEVNNVLNKDLKVTDNGDGTLTIVGTTSGMHKVFGPDGKLLFMQTGQLTFQLMVDTNGTPTDFTDDEEIEGSFVVLRGFTGQNDLEGHEFCDDIHEIIG